MRQADIDRAVARATGETRNVIRQLGFSLLTPPRFKAHGRNFGRSGNPAGHKTPSKGIPVPASATV